MIIMSNYGRLFFYLRIGGCVHIFIMLNYAYCQKIFGVLRNSLYRTGKIYIWKNVSNVSLRGDVQAFLSQIKNAIALISHHI